MSGHAMGRVSSRLGLGDNDPGIVIWRLGDDRFDLTWIDACTLGAELLALAAAAAEAVGVSATMFDRAQARALAVAQSDVCALVAGMEN